LEKRTKGVRVKSEKPVIYVDATSASRNFAAPSSGIPRVEKFILLSALRDQDPLVKIVRLNRAKGAYEEIPDRERESLKEDEDISGKLTGPSFWTNFGLILQKIRTNPWLGPSSDRYYARLMSRPSYSWFRYNGFKLIFRAARLFQKFLKGKNLNQACPLEKEKGALLLSDMALTDPCLDQVIGQSRRRAFICHDLIPIRRPDLLADAGFSKRFQDNLNLILKAPGTTVICTSKTSQAMIESYLRNPGFPRVPVRRFSMPSILYAKAERLGRLSPLEPAEPYVLFCATVEVRKNHLLMARVWQKALEEGVKLPRLVCVGRWGWGNEELKQYLKDHPALAGQIQFVGQRDDWELMDDYRGAMFGVMPSLMEGWGLGASECLDFGVPVIVSNIPALKEATQGLMPALDPHDTAAWYGEIRKMAEDPKYRLSLKTKIKKHHRPIPTRESWESIKRALRGE